MRSIKRRKGMMRYYDIVDTIEDIKRSKTLARAFNTENAELEAAYLKELRKRQKPEGPVHRKNDQRDWRTLTYGKFI